MTKIVPVAVAAPGMLDTAGELRALAAHPRLTARERHLRRLADDLDAGRDLDRWAQIDLYAAFLREETIGPAVRSARRTRAGAALDLVSGLVIFTPILITWFGLFKATAAYRAGRGDAALAGRSFLEQWQTGFGGRLSDWLYFDRIAWWTVLAIVFLMAISAGHVLWQRREERLDRQERAALMGRLTAALTDVDLELSRFRVNDATRMQSGAQHLVDASQEMGRVVDQVRAVEREAAKSLRLVRQAVERVERLADTVAQSGDAVRAAADQLGGTKADLTARLDQVSAATNAVATGIGDLARAAGDDSERTRKALDGTARELRAALTDGQQELAARIAAALERGGEDIRRALDDWRTEGAIYSHRHETTTEHLAAVAGAIEEILRRTVRSLGELPAAVDRFEDHAGQAAQRLERTMTDTSARIADDLVRAADRINNEVVVLLDGLPDGRAQQVAAELAALRAAVDGLRAQIAQTGGRRRWPW
ncbi:hypothetical protein [Thermomonospora cellulosilytica]|uniref:Methyl-accepting chemotaxis protein n=1 Tax=Thermomonospora cellulosilytica TaxID=1411118 RepID=A0A7W3MVB6_9ACTN|nr:hypothetical protein [Thermomonospora cellulosilytica]MBA9002497.1 methyl-accepting chemotaxis protein [Thermomonospora cellulosilytica]